MCRVEKQEAALSPQRLQAGKAHLNATPKPMCLTSCSLHAACSASGRHMASQPHKAARQLAATHGHDLGFHMWGHQIVFHHPDPHRASGAYLAADGLALYCGTLLTAIKSFSIKLILTAARDPTS